MASITDMIRNIKAFLSPCSSVLLVFALGCLFPLQCPLSSSFANVLYVHIASAKFPSVHSREWEVELRALLVVYPFFAITDNFQRNR